MLKANTSKLFISGWDRFEHVSSAHRAQQRAQNTLLEGTKEVSYLKTKKRDELQKYEQAGGLSVETLLSLSLISFYFATCDLFIVLLLCFFSQADLMGSLFFIVPAKFVLFLMSGFCVQVYNRKTTHEVFSLTIFNLFNCYCTHGETSPAHFFHEAIWKLTVLICNTSSDYLCVSVCQPINLRSFN